MLTLVLKGKALFKELQLHLLYSLVSPVEEHPHKVCTYEEKQVEEKAIDLNEFNHDVNNGRDIPILVMQFLSVQVL